MEQSKKMIAIDADYFRTFAEDRRDGDLFLRVIEEYDAVPVMHEYLYEYELADVSILKRWVKDGKIRILRYTDYLSEEARKKYERDFSNAYQWFNYQEFPVGRDVFTYHHGQENLGEIRTILMAVRLGIGIFMSNDKEAKRYVINQINHRSIHINVYNVYDTLAAIGKKVDRQMQWKAVKGMSKAVLSQERYEDIRKIWVNGS